MLLSGIISSLIAVGLLELYILIKKQFRLKSLKSVLSIHSDSCSIVAPIHKQEKTRGLIHHRDAYAFGHLFELVNRLSKEANLIPFHKISETAEAGDMMAVGGPMSNEITEIYIKKYLPTFALIYANEANEMKNVPNTSGYVTGFRIGDESFLTTDEDEFGILIKLTDKVLDQNRSVHLLFGYTARGTAASAYYLWKHFKQICKEFRNEKYFITINVPRNEGYKVISKSFINHTKAAFTN